MEIQLETADKPALEHLFRNEHLDSAWPDNLRAFQQFSAWINQWEMIEWMETGYVYLIINEHKKICGFCTLVCVEAPFSPSGGACTEVGTYLTPQMRGVGYNLQIKSHLRAIAAEKFHSTAMLYIVDIHNLQAQRALEKLPWPTEKVSVDMLHHPWRAFLKRRIWETGKPALLYVQPIDELHAQFGDDFF
ncbi:GNAT family N-acetyltransferase [Alicyclobacillus fodiniaquatilis]|uniref:GNAT family N-acetyltransferase n=1 Tax=Alicyclobacillus fodiniaquatilis TaxID=1661150 RepID=A0ABW4JMG3_9BACL